MNRIVAFIFIILFIGCKKSENTTSGSGTDASTLSQSDPSEKLKTSISGAYNTKKFTSESRLKYNFKLTIADTTYSEGTLLYNIKNNTLHLKSNLAEREISALSENKTDKLASIINEIYVLPFKMNTAEFALVERNDSLVKSAFSSKVNSAEFTLFTHPLTNIIQQLKFSSKHSALPFNDSDIKFQKYITVNRIPVSMRWEIIKNDEQIGEVIISRISYLE